MDVLDLIERIGAYAGFFAVIGLAVLSALYFAQARDVRRLREWAGRAPERAQQGPLTPSAAAPGAARQEQATSVGAAPAAFGPGRSTAAGPAAAQSGTIAPGGVAPGNGDPGRSAPNGGSAPPPIRPIGGPVTSRTEHIPASAAIPAGRGGLAPRYVALILAGVLIIGAGIAYAVVWSAQPSVPAPVAQQAPTAPPVPQNVTVSVLNGTTVPGLAANVGDKVESSGFQLGNVTNATEQQRAESAILYLPGADREARMVGRKLRIAQVERAAASDRVLAGDAKVIVVVGADQGQ